MDTLGAVCYKSHYYEYNQDTGTSDRHPRDSKPSATTKRYDEVFKREAVENWIKSGRRGTQIAAELGVSYPSLKDWKRRYVGDATPVRADLAAENRALKAELTVCVSSATF